MKKIILTGILLSIFAFSEQKEIYIDLQNQKIYMIENKEVILEGDISSGKIGYETPLGEFKISQKEMEHNSTLYPPPNGGASMPYMMRLSGSPVAIHEGYVPQYPASHGCIRVREEFAKKIFSITEIGTKVHILKNIPFFFANEGRGKGGYEEILDDSPFEEVVVEVY